MSVTSLIWSYVLRGVGCNRESVRTRYEAFLYFVGLSSAAQPTDHSLKLGYYHRCYLTDIRLSSQSRRVDARRNRRTFELLCEQAAAEKDPEKFLGIIREINDMLEAKRARLNGVKAESKPSND